MNVEQKHQSGPILAFDTSTASMAAAIVQGNEVIVEIQSLAERNHSVHIITHIKQLLESSGIADKKLEAIAVGNGPGSYTGTPIAVAAAKTLAWVWNKPLVAVSSLEALGYGAWHRGTGTELGQTWDWLEDGNLLVLVSFLVAPFGWIFDQNLAIPAVLFAVSRSPSRTWMFVLALIYFLIEFEIGFDVDLHSRAYLWIAPAWIVWYLFARASVRNALAGQL